MGSVFLDEFEKKSLSIDKDSFNFLNQTGRQKFYKQGFYGQDVIVAVLDSGVNQHPEFEDRILQGTYFVSSGLASNNDKDDFGHGTHVAGTIAGKMCGIAPKAKILPVKVIDGMGEGTVEDIIKALKWVRQWRSKDGKRVDLINMSISCNGTYFKTNPQLLIEYEKCINDLVKDGIAVIVAAGNTGDQSLLYPAAFNEVITVAAVDINRKIAQFSTKSKEVDLAQIGVDVISANWMGGYQVMSGTSMAAPHVTGIAALLISKYKWQNKTYMPENFIYNTLKFNSIDIDEIGIDSSSGAGFCTLNATLGTIIEMIENDKNISVNGIIEVSDCAPTILPPGRFVVPARFVAEKAGGSVSYDVITKKARFEFYS